MWIPRRQGHRQEGSHRTYHRPRDGQTSLTVTVMLGKKDIPNRTLAGMAKKARMSYADFCVMLEINP